MGTMGIEKVGFVGWRGMVGSVLLERMRAEDDVTGLTPLIFTTPQVGQPPPDVGVPAPPLVDAYDVTELARNDAIVSCQGGDYTKQVLPQLRERGWQGDWIDAASAKRLDDDAVIVLDCVNRPAIDRGIDAGVKNYIGGNCTVSLMIMALYGLFREDLVEWMTCMTYQAASGGGAQQMRALIEQMRQIGISAGEILDDPASEILALDRNVLDTLRSDALPTESTAGHPLAGSLLPWIAGAVGDGETGEERKAFTEGNKILGTTTPIPIDSICTRVGSMRCHSQAFTVKLRKGVPLSDIEAMLGGAHEWVHFVPNEPEATLRDLTPAAVTGTLDVPVGRVKKLRMGDDYLAAFSVGDQLLWGAAEPLRRVLRILREKRS